MNNVHDPKTQQILHKVIFFFFFLCTNYSFIKIVIKKIEQVVKNLIGATIYIFFYLGFLSQPFTNHRTTGEGETISLTPHYHFHPLQTLRHWPGNYSRELAPAHK